jgi:hypothetical protein
VRHVVAAQHLGAVHGSDARKCGTVAQQVAERARRTSSRTEVDHAGKVTEASLHHAADREPPDDAAACGERLQRREIDRRGQLVVVRWVAHDVGRAVRIPVVDEDEPCRGQRLVHGVRGAGAAREQIRQQRERGTSDRRPLRQHATS